MLLYGQWTAISQYSNNKWPKIDVRPHRRCTRIRQVTPSSTFPGPTRLSIQNGITIGSAVFCTAQGTVPILYNGPPSRVHIPNDILIGSAVFAGLTIVT